MVYMLDLASLLLSWLRYMGIRTWNGARNVKDVICEISEPEIAKESIIMKQDAPVTIQPVGANFMTRSLTSERIYLNEN